MLSSIQTYVRNIISHVPGWHWVVMCAMSLGLVAVLLVRKKRSVYGAVVVGLTVFVGLFLLDTAVFARYMGYFPHSSGYKFSLSLSRLFPSNKIALTEVIANMAVFVPFGLFLSEAMSTSRRRGGCQGFWRQVGAVTLAGLALSLTIEVLQLLLAVGVFELKDLVLNTVGAFLGAILALLARRIIRLFS